MDRRDGTIDGLDGQLDGSTVVSLAACPGVVVDGGRRVWRRSHDGRQDVEVAFEVPDGGDRTVRVECRGGGS